MESMIRKNKISHITIKPYALWNKNDVLHVSGDGGMVVLVEEQKGCACSGIKAAAMDEVLRGVKVSFIKMDIEGAEQKALEGSENIIRTYRPKLAVSIYHRTDDFYKIPLYIHGLVPEYQFYVRYYTCFYADTVLYAVCR